MIKDFEKPDRTTSNEYSMLYVHAKKLENFISRMAVDKWCHILHHDKNQNHAWHEKCPVEEMFKEIID